MSGTLIINGDSRGQGKIRKGVADRRRWRLFTYIILWRYKEVHKALWILSSLLITVLHWPSHRVDKSGGAVRDSQSVSTSTQALCSPLPKYGRPHARLQFQHHRQLYLQPQPQHRRLHSVGLAGISGSRRSEPDRPHGGGSMPRLHLSGGDHQQLSRSPHLREVSLPLDTH